MKYYDGIIKAIRNKGNFIQGNYAAITDNNVTKVIYYGSKVFEVDNDSGKYKYDFCGYEGYSKTTRLINYCLKAVYANYQLYRKTRIVDNHKIHEYVKTKVKA